MSKALVQPTAFFRGPVIKNMPRKKSKCPLCAPEYIPTAAFDDVRAMAINAAECLARDAREAAERHNDYVSRSKSMASAWQQMTTMLGEGELEELDAILADLKEKLEKQQEKRYLHELNNEQRKAKGKDPSPPDQGV